MNNLGILSKWLSKPTVPVITIRGIIDTKQFVNFIDSH